MNETEIDEDQLNGSVWNFYEETEPRSDKIAQCKLCTVKLSFKSSIRHLKSHLKFKHYYTKDGNDTSNIKLLQSTPIRRNHSLLWSYFTKIAGSLGMATCITCGRDFSYKGTTGNLVQHLKRAHFDAYEKLLKGIKPEANYKVDEDDDSDQSTPKFSSALWSYFEQESTRVAKCAVCRKSMPNKLKMMKNHIREQHSKLMEDLAEDSDCDSNNDGEEESENAYTEIVYLDENFQKDVNNESVASNSAVHKAGDLIINNPSKKSNEFVENICRVKSLDGLTLKERIDDDEIDKFGAYVVHLLKKMPEEVSAKLQEDIVKLITSTKLKMASNKNSTVLNESTNTPLTQSDNIVQQSTTPTEHTNQEGVKLSSIIWTYYNRQSPAWVKCAVCEASVESKFQIMQTHLCKKHPDLMIELDQKSNKSDANDENHALKKYDDILYVDETDTMIQSKQLEIKGESTSKISYEIRRRRLSTEDETPWKKRRVYDDDDEIEQFGTYITCLLKKLSRNVAKKLQKEIVTIIVDAEERLDQNIKTNDGAQISNEIVIESVQIATENIIDTHSGISVNI